MSETAQPIAILLLSGTHERAHYAFLFAAGALAMNRRVTLFASNGGLHALCRDWSGLEGAGDDAALVARGVAGLETLRDACLAMEATLMACEAGLRGMGIASEALMAPVQVAGIPSFLAASAGAQMVTL